MSKKKSAARTALIEARVLEEQEWAYARRILDGQPWHAIRALAMRPRDAGGIGRAVGIDVLKNLVAAHRVSQGEVVGNREERVERRQIEYDNLALVARKALHDKLNDDLYPGLDVHAAKLLLDVRAAEAKMHGDDKPAEVKAEIVTRSAIDSEIDAMLARMGVLPTESEKAT